MIIDAVHLLQPAPGPIKTKNGKTTLRKEFHAHDIFGNQGTSLLPWLAKEKSIHMNAEHVWNLGKGTEMRTWNQQ